MDRIKKNFGFGYMRLPMLENGEVDKEQTCKMVDTFLENGFNYFDTAHGYLTVRVKWRSKTACQADMTAVNMFLPINLLRPILTSRRISVRFLKASWRSVG